MTDSMRAGTATGRVSARTVRREELEWNRF